MNARKIAIILGLLLLAIGIRFHRGGAASAQPAERLADTLPIIGCRP